MTRRRPLALLALTALVVVGASLILPFTARAPAAQTVVEWESLPGYGPFERNRAEVIGFPLAAPDSVHLLVGGGGDAFTWSETELEWEEVCSPAACRATAIAVRDSVIMIGDGPGPGLGGALSLDGGRTWAFDVFHDGPNDSPIDALFWSTHPDSDGSLYVGETFRLHRSDDLGREGTYVPLGAVGGLIEDLAEVPPSAALPNGRILGAVWNGLSLSDDGGHTFRSSNVYQQGSIIGRSFAVYRDPNHPYGAVVYAAVALAEDPPFPGLFRSDDGGATWTETARIEPGDFGVADPDDVDLLVTDDGVLWIGVIDLQGSDADLGVVLRSEDGGRTLEAVDAGWGGYGVRMLAEAPDGRLYAATDSLVWRTVNPVVAVVGEPGPPGVRDLVLRVEPNPSHGQATARWRQASAGAARVTLHDVRGREVLVLSNSHRQPGEHVVEADTSALAPGVYVVRIVSPAGTASARLTVAR